MEIVQTVRGILDPCDLGYCQMHEHVWCDHRMGERGSLNSTVPRDEKDVMVLDDQDRQLRELQSFYKSGGRTLVEVTTSGWGRDLRMLRDLSEKSSVNIVATSGFYLESTIPMSFDAMNISEIAEDLVREFNEGEGTTGIRPGLYKSAASGSRIEGRELKALRAVARAVIETGAAMTTHTSGTRRYEIPGGTVGLQHLKIFREEGAPADRLIVGHVDERPDIYVLDALAKEGCWIQLDVIGQEQWLCDQTRALLIKEMVKRGHLNKLLLGTDRCTQRLVYRELGGLGYTHILDRFLDLLKHIGGLSQRDIEVMMVENPARALMIQR